MQWQKQQHLSIKGGENERYNRDYFIEKAYRVGTTEKQCLNALNKVDEDHWIQYDRKVFSKLFTNFCVIDKND